MEGTGLAYDDNNNNNNNGSNNRGKNQRRVTLNAQRLYVSNLLDDAIDQGAHVWWIVGFSLLFAAFVATLAFASVTTCNSVVTPTVARERLRCRADDLLGHPLLL